MLPPEIQAFCEAHRFHPTKELVGGYCSRIFADETRVLKYPFEAEEKASAPLSAVKLAPVGGLVSYAVDPFTGSVLMERVRPGTTLSDENLPDEEALEIVLGFIMQFPSIDPSGCFDLGGYYTTPDPLIDDLIATTRDRVFLHGDLHHGNVLKSESDWKVIDAKALVGDANFEAIAYLRNPIHWIPVCPDLKRVTLRRLARFKDALGLDPWRMVAWGLVDRRTEPECAPEDPWYKLLPLYTELLEELPRVY